jgi:hypothetical protein
MDASVHDNAVNVEVRRHLVRDGAYRSRKNALVAGLYGLLQYADAHGRAVSTCAVDALAGLLGLSAGDDYLAEARGAAGRRAGRRGELGAGDETRGLPRRGGVLVGEGALCGVAGLAGRHYGEKVLALLGKLPRLMAPLYALIADKTLQADKTERWQVNEIQEPYEQRKKLSQGVFPKHYSAHMRQSH